MSKRYKKIFSWILAGLTLFILSFSFTASEKRIPEKEKFGGTLYGAASYKMAPLNPLTTNSSISAAINAHFIYRGLTKNKANGFYELDLAESLTPSEDGKTLAATLKRGVTFHDGSELTARDVRFTYHLAKMAGDSTKGRSTSNLIDKVHVEGRYRLKIYMKEKNHKMENFLSLGIVPAHLYEGQSDPLEAISRNPIGAGPYKLKYWSPEKILLEANKSFYGKGPYIEKILFTYKGDDFTCWAELLKGSIDFYYQKTPSRLEDLEKNNSIKKYRIISPYYYLVAFNGKNPLFKNQKVKEALNYAIDKKRILEEELDGHGEMMRGPIYLNLLSDSKKGAPFPYNPEKAKELLHEAGLDTLNLKILLPEGENFLQNTLRYIKEDLSHIGVSLTVDLLPLKETMEKIRQKDFDLNLIYLSSHRGPEESYLFWHSSQIEKGINFFSYRNNKVDGILKELNQKKSFREKKSLYEGLNEAMIEDPPGIYLFWPHTIVGVNSRITTPPLTSAHSLNQVNEWYILPPNRKKGQNLNSWKDSSFYEQKLQ